MACLVGSDQYATPLIYYQRQFCDKVNGTTQTETGKMKRHKGQTKVSISDMEGFSHMAKGVSTILWGRGGCSVPKDKQNKLRGL
jgi:hypothetical protein